MKMVRMMPVKWLSLSYYGIRTAKTGLIRLRYGNYRFHVGKKNGFLRFVAVYYGLIGNDTYRSSSNTRVATIRYE